MRHTMFGILCSLIGIFFLSGIPSTAQAQKTVSIAVIGPMSGSDAKSGQAMLQGVKKQVEQINAQGGIQGRDVQVEAYDNQHDKALARKQARKIATESDCVAVIGHYYSSLSLQGGRIYREHGIPAVTSSAVAPELTENNDWYFRVISNNELQGELSALYMSRVLNHSSVSILHEDDAYGQSLASSFMSAAQEMDLEVEKNYKIDSKSDTTSQKLKSISDSLHNGSQPEALYLALLDQEAAEFVKYIRNAGLDIPVFGGDAVGLGTFPEEVDSRINETAEAGDYTDGIYTTTYFIRDVANKKAQKFHREFVDQYERKPDALAATSYDAAGVVVDALAKANLDSSLKDLRKQVRDMLQSYNTPQKSYHGITGKIYFDEKGDAFNPSPFGYYERTNLVSAPVQLTPVHNPDRILDVKKQKQENKLISFRNTLYFKTDVVYTGLDINELTHIDQKDEEFMADFYVWFRHKTPLDYSQIEFFNSNVNLGQQEPLRVTHVDGMSYRVYRIKTKFQEPFQFHQYPFDSQTLRIRLRHKALDREHLIFVADDIGMQRHRGSHLLKRIQEHSGFNGEDKWSLLNVLTFTDIGMADSTLGNPRLFISEAETGITYSRFNVFAQIKRNASSYFFKNAIPLFFVFLLGYSMTFIFPEGPPFAARLNLGIILLLTTVSLSTMTGNQLPNIGYLMTMDYVYYFTYFWLLLAILTTIAVRAAFLYDKRVLHHRLEWGIRILQPALILALLVSIVVIHM
ncbi:MAG: ABC transporter substrate-binding protein [Desulfohalobiaceae bacterium]